VSRDIIVVGAGVIGCAIAYELARRGKAVELIDPRPAGNGATQASAGILAPYLEAHESSPLLRLTARSLELYDDFIGHVQGDSGRAIEYRRTGTLDVAIDTHELSRLKETAAVAAARGMKADLLDAAAARAEEPNLADDVVGALLVPDHGYVAAGDLTRALVEAARRRGAKLIGPVAVRRIGSSRSQLFVETDRGTRRARTIVLAAGCWSGTIDVDGNSTRVPVRPVRGQLLQLAWDGPALRRVTWGGRCYLVPWEDGTVLVGATVEEAGFDERATVAGVRDLLEAACDFVPPSWAAGFRGARVGLRPGTPDALPVLGPSQQQPRLFYATGHYRNGVLLTPITATLMADAIVDERLDPLLESVAPARFGL
jgi:glycine oxidase